jgi:hypothetical protein
MGENVYYEEWVRWDRVGKKGTCMYMAADCDKSGL